MTTILEDLRVRALQQAADKLPEKIPGWLDDGIAAARREIPAATDTSNDASALRILAGQALSKIEAQKADLQQLGPAGVVAMIAYLGANKLDKAVLVYLRETANWDDLFAASDHYRDVTHAEKVHREAVIAAIKAKLLEIGVAGARAALPLLLGAFPL